MPPQLSNVNANPDLYILQNSSNYKPHMTNSIDEIVDLYTAIILNYTEYMSGNFTNKQISEYNYNYSKGFEIISHIFRILFYYTKNLELTYYHSQKACVYYSEFIEQITNDAVTYLQLTSKDAILFVFKRTIFEINKERKNATTTSTIKEYSLFKMFDIYVHTYITLHKRIISHKDYCMDVRHDLNIKYCYLINRIKSLQDQLLPNKSLEERQRNFSEYYLAHGHDLIIALKESLKPLEQAFTILEL